MAVPQDKLQMNHNSIDANDKLDLGSSLTENINHKLTQAITLAILVSAGFHLSYGSKKTQPDFHRCQHENNDWKTVEQIN